MSDPLSTEYADCQKIKSDSIQERQYAIEGKLRVHEKKLVELKAEIKQIQQQLSILEYAFVSIDDYCELFAKDMPVAVKLAFCQHISNICMHNDYLKGSLNDFPVDLYPVILLRRVTNSALWHTYFENNN